MIRLSDVSLLRGQRQLLHQANLTLHPGERVGLVGANGSGKSSLFMLLRGKLATDTGDCQMPRDWRISHMAQEIHAGERSALDYVQDGDTALRRVQARIETAGDDHEQLAHLYAQLEELDGYSAEARAASLLSGLGFASNEMQKPVSAFSGGWRVRLALAQALMCPSDLLLLDEPTNHLDLGATLWLERWLQHYTGTLVIVSHDRDFLDRVVTVTVNIEQQQLFRYQGGYSDFEQQRAERLAQQQQLYQKQQARIKEIHRFVDRFRAKATKAKQAQSRLKELDRMALVAPAHSDSPFDFSIPRSGKMPRTPLTLDEAVIGYRKTPDGEQPVQLGPLNIGLQDSSRVGLLGANGAGKSTLLKSLAGELPLLSGQCHRGEGLCIGYFAQHQLQHLDLAASSLLHLQRLSPAATEQAMRNFLGGFDFQGDRVFEPVSHFSGGEKARLTLALIAWQQPNLLILDEPTNHLDLEMRHALTLALQQFTGAIILVSHDRHLLRNTVDELWLVADNQVQPYDGDLTRYEQWLAEDTATRNQTAGNTVSIHSKKAQRQQAANRRSQRQPLASKLKKLDRQLEKFQARQQALEEELADTSLYQDPDKKEALQQLLGKQADIRQSLEQVEEEWLGIQAQLDALN